MFKPPFISSTAKLLTSNILQTVSLKDEEKI